LLYLRDVEERVRDRLAQPGVGSDDLYFAQLSVFHEDMHDEAFAYTRQTLAYPAPSLRPPEGGPDGKPGQPSPVDGPLPGDVSFPGGRFRLGAEPGETFVFDNEKWAHEVQTAPFAIARAPVTQAEFAAFVNERGYLRREFWDEAGWNWRQTEGALHPVYWRRQPGGEWLRRDFDRWLALEPHRPVLHVNWYEAQAFCRWASRRLPTEAELERAASAEAGPGGAPSRKRRFPWGEGPPSAENANLDGYRLGCLDVAACPSGDSPAGCRQMIGNVWEWTADDFLPYPGFVPDPYREYSQPWFGTHKVLRGGCWVTRGRLLRNTWRNFYRPERRDVWAGFRTCALNP
jgi:iron(II)-dependent oxidoreductase